MSNLNTGFPLFAVGGAHVDRTGRFAGPPVPGASNPGSITETIGGGAFNAARTAAMRGTGPVTFMGVAGGDDAGRRVALAIRDAGFDDQSGVFLDRQTPSYTVMLAPDGDVVAALADMALYDYGFARMGRRIVKKVAALGDTLVLIDANIPASAISLIVEQARGPVHAIAVSPAKAVRLRDAAAHIATLFCNRREAFALTGNPDAADQLAGLAELGFTRVAMSDGAAAVHFLDHGHTGTVNVPAVEHISDVTGAGDALAGGSIAALGRGVSYCQALCEGIACAGLTLGVHGPVADSLTGDAFQSRLKTVYAANPQFEPFR